MRVFVPLAVALALASIQSATAQEAATPAPVQPEAAAPIAVTPGSMAAGSAAGVVVVILTLGVVAVALSSF